MLTHRQSARRKTRAWQLGALGCVAAAGAAVAIPTDFLTPKAPPISDSSSAATIVDTRPALDAASIHLSANVLESLAPRHIAPPEPVPDVTGPDVVVIPPPPPEPVVGVWTYIGSIITPSSKKALVKVDQQQHIFAEGSHLEQTKIVSITPSEITIETGGVQRTITLAGRSTDWPTDPPRRPIAFRNPAAPGAMQPMAARPGMPTTTPPPMSADMARAQAMAENARRQQQAANPPQRPEGFDPGSQESREMTIKMLQDPNMEPQRQMEMLEQLGIKPGMTVDESTRQLKESGIEVNDAMLGIFKAVESGIHGEANDAAAQERAKKREAKRGKGG